MYSSIKATLPKTGILFSIVRPVRDAPDSDGISEVLVLFCIIRKHYVSAAVVGHYFWIILTGEILHVCIKHFTLDIWLY